MGPTVLLAVLLPALSRAGEPCADFRARWSTARGLDTHGDPEIALVLTPASDVPNAPARELVLVAPQRPSMGFGCESRRLVEPFGEIDGFEVCRLESDGHVWLNVTLTVGQKRFMFSPLLVAPPFDSVRREGRLIFVPEKDPRRTDRSTTRPAAPAVSIDWCAGPSDLP